MHGGGNEGGVEMVHLSRPFETGDDGREQNMWAFATAALNLLEECICSE